MSSLFMPHGHCYLWQPAMVWLQVGSNLAIALSYIVISAMLGVLVYRIRDLPFKLVYACFSIFIISCGMTHFMEIVTIWYPIYWVDAGLRCVTALASVGTALLMPTLLPRAMALVTSAREARSRGIALETVVKDLSALLASTQRTRDILQQENETYTNNVETLALALQARRHDLQGTARLARQAQLEAEKGNRFKDEFLNMVSHELRTPLTALSLQITRMMRADKVQDAITAGSLLAQMRLSVVRLEHIIDSLLHYTRLKKGHFVSHDVPCGLANLLEEVGAAGAALGRMREVAIELRWAGPPIQTVCVDPHILRLILDNLLSNAIKFSPRGSRVVLKGIATVDAVAVEVIDEGPGISVQFQQTIFEPFVHLEAVANKHTPGVGLGLALVRDMVEVLKGRLDLESHLGVGSTFRVTFARRA